MTKKKEESPQELPFPSPEFAEKWYEYIDMRTEKKVDKYTPIGLRNAFKKLIRLSENNEETAIKILQQSLENGWAGTFELKNNKNARSTTYWQTIGNGRIDGSQVETAL